MAGSWIVGGGPILHPIADSTRDIADPWPAGGGTSLGPVRRIGRAERRLRMADLVTSLASQTGIDPEKVRKGLGALIAFLKEHLGDEVAGKVQAAIPGAKEMVSEFESGQGGSGGGLFGAAADLAGKLV